MATNIFRKPLDERREEGDEEYKVDSYVPRDFHEQFLMSF